MSYAVVDQSKVQFFLTSDEIDLQARPQYLVVELLVVELHQPVLQESNGRVLKMEISLADPRQWEFQIAEETLTTLDA